MKKNRDRDEKHQRRRTVGREEEQPDGREVARSLYGGRPAPDADDKTGTEEPSILPWEEG